MGRHLRLAFVAIATGSLFGIVLVGLGVRFANVTDSNTAMLGLATVLFGGNFYLLRQGLRWAAATERPVRPTPALGEEPSAPLVLQATH